MVVLAVVGLRMDGLMLVTSLWAGPYVDYPKVERAFPQRGLTLITGANGAGKSSVYEMVAWCLYGQTVRGASVRRAASVSLTVLERGDHYYVERARGKRGAAKLSFKMGAVDLTGATPTETQKAIDRELGSFEQFCSGRVFARDLLAKFALATDKDRKNLVEEYLGLQQFDRAHKAAMFERGSLDVAARTADALVPSVAAALEQARKQRDLYVAMKFDDPEGLQRELDELDVEARREGARLEELSVTLTDLNVRLQEAMASDRELEKRRMLFDSTAARLRTQIERHQSGEDTCETCGRTYDDATRADAVALLEERLEREEELRAKLPRKKSPVLQEEWTELREEYEQVRTRRQERAERLVGLRHEHVLAQGLADNVRSTQGALDRAEEALLAAQARRDEARTCLLVGEAACQALGLAGARCLLLGKALVQLEREANAFLAQVHPELRVQLAGKSTTAAGKEVDKISVEVTGAGDGDYRACSGGQRVLVDVALMLGMAAMRGGDGLLVFDEVFDSLDAARVEVVAAHLQDIARHRQVLVISHREDFASLFRTAARWRAVKDADGVATLEDA